MTPHPWTSKKEALDLYTQSEFSATYEELQFSKKQYIPTQNEYLTTFLDSEPCMTSSTLENEAPGKISKSEEIKSKVFSCILNHIRVVQVMMMLCNMLEYLRNSFLKTKVFFIMLQ